MLETGLSERFSFGFELRTAKLIDASDFSCKPLASEHLLFQLHFIFPLVIYVQFPFLHAAF